MLFLAAGVREAEVDELNALVRYKFENFFWSHDLSILSCKTLRVVVMESERLGQTQTFCPENIDTA
jgi:hypothetical protein